MNMLDGAVVVLTGASSGIGRIAAEMFAKKHAKLVLASRAEAPLQQVMKLCVELGAEAIVVPTDVRDESAVLALRDAAVQRFGRIDVWVNDAAVYMMGALEEVPSDVVRLLLETNVMGVVHGAKAALSQFRKQGTGTLISVGSVAGKVPYAKASAYCASKHAVHALTAALRQELVGTKIEACVVAPASVDTPLFDHAANFTGLEMKVMPPIYRPHRVAREIVRCAEFPRREVLVGATPRVMSLFHAFMPWLYERVLPRFIATSHLGRMPAPKVPGNVSKTLPPYAVAAGWKRGRESVLEPLAGGEAAPLIAATVTE